MDGSVRYTRSRDGTRIAFSVTGDGPALALLQVPTLSHVEGYPLVPGVRAYLDRIGKGRRLIRLDFRGTGMSERNVADHSAGAFADDLEAVLHELHVDSLDIVAGGARVNPALGVAVRQPEAIRRIVLSYPFNARRERGGQPGEPGLLALMESNWDMYLEFTTQRNTRRPITEVQEVLAYVRRCVDSRNSVAEMAAWPQEELWQWAALVSCPVLVLDYPGNVRIPTERVRTFAAQFSAGEYLSLPESALPPPYGDAELALAAILEFLGAPDEPISDLQHLTAREREILRLLTAGRTQPEIAGKLSISPSTVSRHVVSLYAKIGAHRRAEAVSWAIRNGLG